MNHESRIMNQGFTLIEVIVVVAIVAVCFGVLADLFIGHNRLYNVETAELTVTSDARVALDDIDNFVRQGYRTLSSYSTYTAGPAILILQIQSVNASNQLMAGTYDHVVFYLTGTNLFRQVFPGTGSTRPAATKKLASNVSSLVFTYNNADYALVTNVASSITINQTAGAGGLSRSITLSSKARLRNY